MKMLRAFLFVLLVALCSVYADDDEECTIKAEPAIKSVGEMVKKIEPITIKNIPPTIWVKASGVSGLTLMSGKEVQTTQNNGVTSSKFFVVIPEIYVEALLELSSNPMDIPPVIQKGMTDAVKKNCPPEKVADVQKGVASAGVPTMSLKDMLGLTECQPAIPGVPKVPGIGRKRRAAELFQGMIYIKWKNVKVVFRVDVKADKVTIASVDLLSKDYDKIQVTCEGKREQFARSCKCVVATKFPVQLITTAVNVILPCTVDGEAQKHKNIIENFDCTS